MKKIFDKLFPNKITLGKTSGAGLVDGVIAMGVIGMGLAANVSIFSSSSTATRGTVSSLSFAHLKANISQKLHSKTIVMMSSPKSSSLYKCISSNPSYSKDCNISTDLTMELKEPGASTKFIGKKAAPAYYRLSGEETKDVSKAAYQVYFTSVKALCHETTTCDLASEVVFSYEIAPVTKNYKILGVPSEAYFYDGKNLKRNFLDLGEATLLVSAFKVQPDLTTSDCNPGAYKRTMKDGHRIFTVRQPKVLQGFTDVTGDGKRATALCDSSVPGAKVGLAGNNGAQGTSGIKGPRGHRGPSGNRGPRGYRGARPGAYSGYFIGGHHSAVHIPRDNSI